MCEPALELVPHRKKGLRHRVGPVEQLAAVLGNHAWATAPGTAGAAARQQLELLAQQAVTLLMATVGMPEPRLLASLEQLALLTLLDSLARRAMHTATTVVMLEMAVWGRLATYAAAGLADLRPLDLAVPAGLVGCSFALQLQV